MLFTIWMFPGYKFHSSKYFQRRAPGSKTDRRRLSSNGIKHPVLQGSELSAWIDRLSSSLRRYRDFNTCCIYEPCCCRRTTLGHSPTIPSPDHLRWGLSKFQNGLRTVVCGWEAMNQQFSNWKTTQKFVKVQIPRLCLYRVWSPTSGVPCRNLILMSSRAGRAGTLRHGSANTTIIRSSLHPSPQLKPVTARCCATYTTTQSRLQKRWAVGPQDPRVWSLWVPLGPEQVLRHWCKPHTTVFCHVQYAPVYTAHPHFWPKLSGNKSFILIFNSIFYSFISRNKTNYCIPGYYFAYRYHYCFLELQF